MELGTGFEADLSGRENIFFNGAPLGVSRAYMRAHVDDIIALDLLDVARLAFAVATSIEAETILLDEILAVGDAAFRRQCYARIERFVSGGATVVVVSHDLEPLESLCSRALWVAEGKIIADGDVAEVISRYRRSLANA
jgi:ABC-type polysaccharide/polyol phosphate transport system ATPase subunit